jgi:hypothetical protein
MDLLKLINKAILRILANHRWWLPIRKPRYIPNCCILNECGTHIAAGILYQNGEILMKKSSSDGGLDANVSEKSDKKEVFYTVFSQNGVQFRVNKTAITALVDDNIFGSWLQFIDYFPVPGACSKELTLQFKVPTRCHQPALFPIKGRSGFSPVL